MPTSADHMFAIRAEKRAVRYALLLAFFKEKHLGRDPEGAFELYTLKLLQDLGEVYDINSEEIKDEIRKQKVKHLEAEHELMRREAMLNNISHYIRIGLGMSTANAGKES